MRVTSSELERFLRRTVDSGIVVRSTLGLGIGQTGVAFQYQSEQQVVMVFLEFSTAASLILAPSYAPREAVEEIANRETFRDGELERLGDVHHQFLGWLKECVDENLEPSEGRFFSRSEPLPDEVLQSLQNLVPLACYVSVLGYPEGTIHIFTNLSPEDLNFPEQNSSQHLNLGEDKSEDESVIPLEDSNQTWMQWLLGAGIVVIAILLVVVFSQQQSKSITEVQNPSVETVRSSQPRIKISQVRIPHGAFIMGCTETDCLDNETPHRVSLTKDFFMMESEVTQDLYASVMRKNPSHHYRCGGLCPVENISWNDAVEFANRLSINHDYKPCYRQEGTRWLWNQECKGWRLPTETEWEYAALGVRTDKGESAEMGVKAVPVKQIAWHLSDKELQQVPNKIGMKDEERMEMARLLVQSHPVCQRPKNGYGLCDMSGNVWEWVWDGYEADSATRDHNAENPSGPELARSRVLKGGSFADVLPDVMPHRRMHLAPWATNGVVTDVTGSIPEGTVGFRLVRTAQ